MTEKICKLSRGLEDLKVPYVHQWTLQCMAFCTVRAIMVDRHHQCLQCSDWMIVLSQGGPLRKRVPSDPSVPLLSGPVTPMASFLCGAQLFSPSFRASTTVPPPPPVAPLWHPSWSWSSPHSWEQSHPPPPPARWPSRCFSSARKTERRVEQQFILYWSASLLC